MTSQQRYNSSIPVYVGTGNGWIHKGHYKGYKQNEDTWIIWTGTNISDYWYIRAEFVVDESTSCIGGE